MWEKKIHPELLLSTDTIVAVPEGMKTNRNDTENNEEKQDENMTPNKQIQESVHQQQEKSKCLPNPLKAKRKILREKYNRNDILENMRQDRIKQHGERLALGTERLQIEKEKLKERKRKNDLIEERNNLLKMIKNQRCLPDEILNSL